MHRFGQFLVALVFAVAAPALARAQEPLMLAAPASAIFETPSAAQYARTLTNKSISNLMTKAIMPSLTHEDPHYYRSGEGGVFSRMAYAAHRSFTLSEVAGTAAAAGLSNIYYSPADRTATGTLTRWGTQMMWDTVANELKEFWPDIRARLRSNR
jgi:hypothetical protein